MVTNWFRPARRHNKKPNIVVLVGTFARWINHVDIQIDRRFEKSQPVNSCLFRRLSQCNPGQVGIAICVAARL